NITEARMKLHPRLRLPRETLRRPSYMYDKLREKLRIAHVALRNARAAFHPGEANYALAIGEFGDFRVAFRDGTADEQVIAHSFENDIFFSDVPEYQPFSDDVVIDIGAHIGTFSLLAASKLTHGKVHAVEASQESYNYLRINTALNPRLSIIPHRLALSDCDGEVMLHHDRENWGHSIMKRYSPRGEKVPAASLSTFMEAQGIREVAFIKFNCEGAEFPIVMTAPVETLKRIRIMLILYHLDLVDGYSLHDLVDRLMEAGFHISIRNQTSRRGWIIASR